MNKREAAEYLGKTERAVERYTEAARLTVRYKPGKTRPVADYDESELRALKHELDNPSDVRPVVVAADTPTNTEQPRRTASEALQRTATEQSMTMFVSLLSDAIRDAQAQAPGTESLADLSAKVMLTLKDAARLSSLSEAHLRAALNGGMLKGKIVGRGWKIAPDALRAYVAKVLK